MTLYSVKHLFCGFQWLVIWFAYSRKPERSAWEMARSKASNLDAGLADVESAAFWFSIGYVMAVGSGYIKKST